MQFRCICYWSYSYAIFFSSVLLSLTRLRPRNPAQYLWQMILDTFTSTLPVFLHFCFILPHNNKICEIYYLEWYMAEWQHRVLGHNSTEAYQWSSERRKFMIFNIKFIISCRPILFFFTRHSSFQWVLVDAVTMNILNTLFSSNFMNYPQFHTYHSPLNHERNYLSHNHNEKLRRKLIKRRIEIIFSTSH